MFIFLIQIAALEAYVWKVFNQHVLKGTMSISPVFSRETAITRHTFGFITKLQPNRAYLLSALWIAKFEDDPYHIDPTIDAFTTHYTAS